MHIPHERLKTALQPGSMLEAWRTYVDSRGRRKRTGGQWLMEVVRLGVVPIHSGRVMAGDPGMCFDMTDAFERSVAPGEYDAFASIVVPYKRPWRWLPWRSGLVSMGYDPRAAYLSLMISKKPIMHFEFAKIANKGKGDRPIDRYDGFGVDLALAAIIDAEDGRRVQKLPGDMTLANRVEEQNARRKDTRGLAAIVDISEIPSARMAACQSGWGDGAYLSYWALDSEGDPAALIVDFDLGGMEE